MPLTTNKDQDVSRANIHALSSLLQAWLAEEDALYHAICTLAGVGDSSHLAQVDAVRDAELTDQTFRECAGFRCSQHLCIF